MKETEIIQAWSELVALPRRFLFGATTNWANMLLRANMRKHNDSNNNNNYTNNKNIFLSLFPMN